MNHPSELTIVGQSFINGSDAKTNYNILSLVILEQFLGPLFKL